MLGGLTIIESKTTGKGVFGDVAASASSAAEPLLKVVCHLKVVRHLSLKGSGSMPREGEVLNQTEENLSALIDSTEDFIWSVDTEYRLLTFNSALQRYYLDNFGTQPEVGMRPEHLLPPLRAERWPDLYRRAMAEGRFSTESTRADGRTTRLTLNRIVVHGRTAGVSVFGKDITELKLAEKSLVEAQEARLQSEERFRTAFQTSLDAIAINRLDDGAYIECNKAFLDISGYERNEIIGQSSLDLEIWADRRDRQKMLNTLRLQSHCRDLEAQFRKKSGEVFWGLMSASLIEPSGVPCVLSITRDISDARTAADKLASTVQALRMSEERYRTVFLTSYDGILINRLDDGIYIDANPRFLEFMGFDRSEVIGKSNSELSFWADSADRARFFADLRLHSSCHAFEAEFRKNGGEQCWAQLSASIIQIDGVACLLTMSRDITQAKVAEEEIRKLAFYDTLTALPNRRLLMERLRQGYVTDNRTVWTRALLFLDLDGFKTLNDTLGHQAGDLLLQEVARRLRALIHETDFVGRLGGDEFVVILEHLNEIQEHAAEQAKTAAGKILSVVEQPYLLDGQEWLATASIGITTFRSKQENTSEILKQADIAMYQAKESGRNTFCLFTSAS
ncbi:MAG TPA: PAS domain S-box protein [Terracidiphilus sp.]|jgi:diguanylate cyclase (GGDEF)-like protein/PAS domain S-box-containing protein